jgi:hypothetical protein
MKALFSFGEHCALVGQLWTDPSDALDQAPVRALSQRPDTVQCPGADGHGQSPEQVSVPASPGDRINPAPLSAQDTQCLRVTSAR